MLDVAGFKADSIPLSCVVSSRLFAIAQVTGEAIKSRCVQSYLEERDVRFLAGNHAVIGERLLVTKFYSSIHSQSIF